MVQLPGSKKSIKKTFEYDEMKRHQEALATVIIENNISDFTFSEILHHLQKLINTEEKEIIVCDSITLQRIDNGAYSVLDQKSSKE